MRIVRPALHFLFDTGSVQRVPCTSRDAQRLMVACYLLASKRTIQRNTKDGGEAFGRIARQSATQPVARCSLVCACNYQGPPAQLPAAIHGRVVVPQEDRHDCKASHGHAGVHAGQSGQERNLSTHLTKLNSGTAPATPWKSIVSSEKSGSWLRWTAVLRFHSPPLFCPPLGI